MFVAPSRRVLLLLRAVPLTLVLRARSGVSVTAFWNLRGRRARNEVHEALVVPVVPERQAHDLLAVELRMNVTGVRLQQRGLGLHGDRLGEGPDLERHVDAGDRRRRDRDAVAVVLLESAQDHPDLVGAGLHVDEAVNALGAGGGLAGEVRVRVDERDRSAGDRRAAAVRHVADQRPIEDLGAGRRGERHERRDQERQRKNRRVTEATHGSNLLPVGPRGAMVSVGLRAASLEILNGPNLAQAFGSVNDY